MFIKIKLLLGFKKHDYLKLYGNNSHLQRMCCPACKPTSFILTMSYYYYKPLCPIVHISLQ